MMTLSILFYFITQGFFFEAIARPSSLDDIIAGIEKQVSPVKNKGMGGKDPQLDNDGRKVVCTRSFRSNFRKGPSINFPVEYEILKSGYPLRVIKNVDTWYATEDFEGRIAWLGSVNVRSKCGAIVSKGGFAPVYFTPNTKSKILFSLERGYIITEIECQTEKWCSVAIKNTRGWIKKDNVWGNI